MFASAEATYFLGNINFNYENNYKKAVSNFEQLSDRYPRNNYYARLLAKSYYKLNQYTKGLAFIDSTRGTKAAWQRQQLPRRNRLYKKSCGRGRDGSWKSWGMTSRR
ncbi:MAG: hypothetical protein U5J63_05695 [Fodinibius sp.]|nr:hypothetical protein [Fodinibius sp.]